MLQDRKIAWLIGACLLVGLLEFLSLANIRLPNPVAIPFFIFIILAIGYETLWHGLKALLTLNFSSINTLMLIAVAGAFALGKYEEAAVVIVLYTLAEKLEDFGIQKSQSALNALLNKMPKTVSVKGRSMPVPLSEVQIGDIMIVRPSDLIPLDGQIITGSSYVDESTITGEPIPQDKFVGDAVYAGTWNKQGYLEVKVEKQAQDTTIAKIREITFKAEAVKSHTQQFIEKFSRYYTPAVILLALMWMTIPPLVLGQSFQFWFLQGLALLVIACPCALVISTPISIFSAIGNASTQGALIKGGRFLELLGRIKAIALDKTRTLTKGQPIVTDVIPIGNHSKDDVLECAAGIEIFSEHPLAQSIVEAAKLGNLTPHEFADFQSFVGKGAKGNCLVCHDSHHCIGKIHFILEEHEVPKEIINEVDRLQSEGKTSIVLATNKQVEGIIGLADCIRPESQALVKGLKDLQVTPIMVTGDHFLSAQLVAKELGITEVKAEKLPEEKAQVIQELLHKYKNIAMVGDGVNDAPALALSSVGISMGSIANDIALEAASIVILHNRLDIIPFLIRLGRRTVQTIQFNIFLATSIKVIFIALALAGLSNLALAIFADVGVTLIVILISLHLMKWRAN